jgi:hypothetical protein
VHVTSCVLLVLKLAVTATIGLNRDSTKLSKTAGSGLFKVPEEIDSFTIMKCPSDLLYSREDENLRKLTESMVIQIIFRGHPENSCLTTGPPPCPWPLARLSPQLGFRSIYEDDLLFFLQRSLNILCLSHGEVQN